MHVGATVVIRRPPTGSNVHYTSVFDLLHQTRIRYGTLNTGVILKELRYSNDTRFQEMWRNMRGFHPNVFTRSNEEGIERARKGNYAFILPHTIGEYISRRLPCDLAVFDRFFMDGAYGLAVHKGATLLPHLNEAILLLETNGFLEQLYYKWWVKNASECNGVKVSKHTFSHLPGRGEHLHNGVYTPLYTLTAVILSVTFRTDFV